MPNYLKSMHKCTSYGPGKLNLRPFYHLTFVSLTINLPEQLFQMVLSPRHEEELCQIILKSMHCRSYVAWKNSD